MSVRFEFRPGTIRYGNDCVTDLSAELADIDVERALVVCGRTVGSTPEVIDPVREGLGERLAGVFAETRPRKGIATAIDAAERARELDADAVVGLGGGSSLDQAKVAAALTEGDHDRESVVAHFADTGGVPVAETGPAVVAVPTTLAGADLTQVAGVSAGPDVVAEATGQRSDGRINGGVGHERLMPRALFYDPELYRTTPASVLRASAMNGFDKAVETPYARSATPVTDATASRALRLLGRGLPALGDGKRDDETMHDAIVGTVLAQYGVSRPDAVTLSLIHAFGHALSRPYDLQQGAAHAIAAPHALAYLFEHTDARRRLLAEGLGVDTEGMDDVAVADAVVEEVAAVRDALGLPSRLRSVEGIRREDFSDIAGAVVEDGMTPNAPVDPTREEIESVLEAAW